MSRKIEDENSYVEESLEFQKAVISGVPEDLLYRLKMLRPESVNKLLDSVKKLSMSKCAQVDVYIISINSQLALNCINQSLANFIKDRNEGQLKAFSIFLASLYPQERKKARIQWSEKVPFFESMKKQFRQIIKGMTSRSL